VSAADPDEQRAEMLERWERAAPGWGSRADRVREFGMPVSEWMIDQLELQPGQRVLELAAGPGDTGFLASELIAPGGTLISSDAAEAMLDVARARAERLGIKNVEFSRLELEWIDLPTASVDRVLCRWGYMLILDPEAALRETRRVLRPGGRLALAVWDASEHNPWATIPGKALVELGYAEPPDADAPGMFALSRPGRLSELLHAAGFGELTLGAVDVGRTYAGLDEYLQDTLGLSRAFADVLERLSDDERAALERKVASLVEPFTGSDGSIRLPGQSLVAAADA
jgi:SAM-dependent methyltransferase